MSNGSLRKADVVVDLDKAFLVFAIAVLYKSHTKEVSRSRMIYLCFSSAAVE